MTMPSPYGSTPGGADYGYEGASPSPTPSPGWYPPQRPATRAAYTHYRNGSNGFNDGPADRGHPPPPPPNFSPRYRSDGSYGTVPVSPSYIIPAASPRRRRHHHDDGEKKHKHRESGGDERGEGLHHHRRRKSSSHHRPSFSYGDADETVYLYRKESSRSPSRSKKSPRRASTGYSTRVVYEIHSPSRRDTDYYRYFEQGGYSQSQQQQQQPQPQQSPRGYESPSPHRGPGGYESPHHEPAQPDYHRRGESPSARQREDEMRRQHMRRSSTAAGIPPPMRPQTARPVMHKPGSIPRPGSSHKKPAAATAAPAANKRKATEKDAEKWKIPLGYSLKNWDPDETPMLLLGSVFDANSLGKWIYDWTVFHQGPATPIAEMAGELWLLLIQVSGKTKRAEEGVTQVRRKESAELIEDFIASGHRLIDRLKKLLKACEQPMLKANRTKKDKALGKQAGVEFVETLFGRDRELERTEKFMQAARVWDFRFEANCEEILKNPKK